MLPLFGFVLHAAVIFGATSLLRIRNADFVRCLGVAAASYAAFFVLLLLVSPFMLAPAFSTTFGSLMMAIATAVAARFVLPCAWTSSAAIGLITGLANAVLTLLLH